MRVQTALDEAQHEHEEKAQAVEAERAAIEKKGEAEDARWENEKERLTRHCVGRGNWSAMSL